MEEAGVWRGGRNEGRRHIHRQGKEMGRGPCSNTHILLVYVYLFLIRLVGSIQKYMGLFSFPHARNSAVRQERLARTATAVKSQKLGR